MSRINCVYENLTEMMLFFQFNKRYSEQDVIFLYKFTTNYLMKRNLILICFFFYISITTKGQDPFESQKIVILNSDLSQDWKIDALFDLAINNANTDPMRSLDLLVETQDLFQIDSLNHCLYAKLLSRIGVLKYYLTDYSIALDYFYKALDLQQNRCKEEDVAFSLNAIGNVFISMGEYEKSIDYYEQSLVLKRKLGDTKVLTGTISNMGTAYTSMRNFVKADSCFKDVLSILMKQPERDYYNLATVHNNLAILYKDQDNYDLALKSNLEALKYAQEVLQNQWLYTYILHSITEIYILLHDYDYAKKYLDKAFRILGELNSDDLLMFAYRNATFYYAGTGDLENSIDYFWKYSNLKDHVLSEEKQRKLVEAQVKYETEQTAKENALQKFEIEKGERIQILMISIFLMLLLFFVLLFFIYQNRMKANREKEILSATIKTEERERTKFAEELHDSLGALLSSMRIYTDILNTQLQQNSYDKNALDSNFEMLNTLLNDAIVTTKEVSNGLIPNVLTDFGLIDTLYSYFTKINRTNTINIDFDVDDNVNRFELNEEIAYFRIISELLNNTLKHAQAKNIRVRIGIKKDKMFIQYNDDGVGFNYKTSSKKGTMGLQNIISRAKSIGAEYYIKSSPLKGFVFFLTKTLN